MPKKILFCATVDTHFESFHLPYFKWFKDQGWEVHIAANGVLDLPFVDEKYNIPVQRSPFKFKNIHSSFQLKKIIEQNKFDIIHCHTPMGGVISRLAGRNARKAGTKVIYTAHGFHFYEGAPIQNWLLYYPIEKWLCNYTDCLITINNEDYHFAKKHFKNKQIEHVYGVGVNTSKFKPIELDAKIKQKKSLGYQADDFLLFYAAEFNENKNQKFLISMMSSIKKQTPQVKLLLAGEGFLMDECKKLAKHLGLEEMINFLGHRTDIDAILPICDVTVASSLREGLPVNIMEAMSCGLPVVATENRGHKELIKNDRNGWIVGKNSFLEMGEKIKILVNDPEKKIQFGNYGRKMIEEKYCIQNVLEQKSKIYKKFMNEKEAIKWLAQ
ncbi:glycosyltransferase family 4 protein [Neobacillus drentensis]|uniref:glycosyltransferase family 4 protein n=1 Tax=Neobacillus drentensis TaxID=220684 RepID=UPI002FFF3321